MSEPNLTLELADMLSVMMGWAREISDEYLDGDPEVRLQYLEDMESARGLIAKALGDPQ